MRIEVFTLLGVGLLGCAEEMRTPEAGTSPNGGESKSVEEDERGSVGPPGPAVPYCTGLGYTVQSIGQTSTCLFPDGTSCEVWSFYYGKCGQPHSYCNTHGGQVSNEERNMGTWTATVAVCALGGKTCDEADFVKREKCE